MNADPKQTTHWPAIAGVKIKTSNLLPPGAYALTKGGSVVWDSITQQPAGLPDDYSRWDGVMVSPSDFERIKREASST